MSATPIEPTPIAEPDPLAAAEARVREMHPPPDPPPAPDPAIAGTIGAEDADAIGDGLDKIGNLAESPEQLPEFTVEEIADVTQLFFDMVADIRGEHWRFPRTPALRFARWAKKCLDQLTEVPAWVLKLIPWAISTALILHAIRQRYEIDLKLAEEKKKAEADGGTKGAAA